MKFSDLRIATKLNVILGIGTAGILACFAVANAKAKALVGGRRLETELGPARNVEHIAEMAEKNTVAATETAEAAARLQGLARELTSVIQRYRVRQESQHQVEGVIRSMRMGCARRD